MFRIQMVPAPRLIDLMRRRLRVVFQFEVWRKRKTRELQARTKTKGRSAVRAEFGSRTLMLNDYIDWDPPKPSQSTSFLVDCYTNRQRLPFTHNGHHYHNISTLTVLFTTSIYSSHHIKLSPSNVTNSIDGISSNIEATGRRRTPTP
jgi:hypothetical protein